MKIISQLKMVNEHHIIIHELKIFSIFKEIKEYAIFLGLDPE
jgi:hypothetical protein